MSSKDSFANALLEAENKSKSDFDYETIDDLLKQLVIFFNALWSEHGDEMTRCPCGVAIKERCYIESKSTGTRIYVGNCCFKRFGGSLVKHCVIGNCNKKRWKECPLKKLFTKYELLAEEENAYTCRECFFKQVIKYNMIRQSKAFWKCWKENKDKMKQNGVQVYKDENMYRVKYVSPSPTFNNIYKI